MKVLGFGYDEVISSEEPMHFEFDKINDKCSVYCVNKINEKDTFFILKNEVVLRKGMNVLFAYSDGLIHSTINKIDYDKKRVKVGKIYISENDCVLIVGVNNEEDINIDEFDMEIGDGLDFNDDTGEIV